MAVMEHAALTGREFRQFQEMIHRIAGISMSDAKMPLVSGRLAKQVKHHGLPSFGAYFELLMRDKAELQIAVDLLTTNETYFFREPAHMTYLGEKILPTHARGRPFRLWSAASSSGEEVYSLAMVLADKLGDSAWEVLGSDISSRVLEKARGGHYSLERAGGIPKPYLSRFCLKGVGAQAGTFLVGSDLRRRVSFRQVNLVEPPPSLGEFDVIFLRNVMIYFDQDTKRKVVRNLLPLLRPGGHFFISHSESLNGISEGLLTVAPSVYRKVDD